MKRWILFLALVLAIFIIPLQICHAQVDVEIEKKDDDTVIAQINIESSRKSSPGAIRLYDDDRNYYVNTFTTNSRGEKTIYVELEREKEIRARVNVGGKIERFSFETDESYEKAKAEIWIIGYDELVYSDDSAYIEDGESVLEFMERICEDNDIDFESRYGYVARIGEDEEKDYGVKSGWMYYLDRESPNLSSEEVDMEERSEIVWAYTIDLGEDLDNIFHIVDGDMEIIRDDEVDRLGEMFESMRERGVERIRLNFKKLMDKEYSAEIEEKNDKKAAEISISFDNKYPARITAGEAMVSMKSMTFEDEVDVDIEEVENGTYSIRIDGDRENSQKAYVHMERGLWSFENPYALSCCYAQKGSDEFVRIPTVYDMESGEFTCEYAGYGRYTVGQAQEQKTFGDIGGVDEITRRKLEAVASYGIMGGYPDGSFRPDGGLTRAEMAKIIVSFEREFGDENGGVDKVKSYEELPSSPFADVKNGDWHYDYVIECLEEGYLKGSGDSTFDPNGMLTREQAAVILRRLDGGGSTEKFDILDIQEISPWALDSVYYVLGRGIMRGREDFKFRPQREITRMELANAIYEMMD